jgi:hypothetical protein
VRRPVRVLVLFAALVGGLLLIAATASGTLERGLLVAAVLVLTAVGTPFVLRRAPARGEGVEGLVSSPD